MARGTEASTSQRTLPLVAVGYGPRCVPVMQLAEAAAGVCDLLWMIDGAQPGMPEMAELLQRFGPVLDLSGLGVAQMATLLSAYEPDALVTYLDTGMVAYAELAEALGLPFHSPATAAALTDKSRNARSWPRPVWTCRPATSSGPTNERVTWPTPSPRWDGRRSSSPGRPRAAATPSWPATRAELDRLLTALGPDRPDMVLEGYLADVPARAAASYAAYVSVESVVASGVISHLALTGRFPLAENFRETGFFIPAALEEGEQESVLALATAAIEALDIRIGCLHTEIKFTPAVPASSRSTVASAEGCPRCSSVPPGFRSSNTRYGSDWVKRSGSSGPVATERIGYRFFLQPPAVSATVAAIDGIDKVSDFPGVDTISVHQGPGADLDWRDGTRNHIMAVVGSAADYAELAAVNRLLLQEVTVTYADVKS